MYVCRSLELWGQRRLSEDSEHIISIYYLLFDICCLLFLLYYLLLFICYLLGSVQVLHQRIFQDSEPPPPPLHQRNQRGSRPPPPLYFADVILEHEVWVSILFRGLFLMHFMIVLGTKIIIKA